MLGVLTLLALIFFIVGICILSRLLLAIGIVCVIVVLIDMAITTYEEL